VGEVLVSTHLPEHRVRLHGPPEELDAVLVAVALDVEAPPGPPLVPLDVPLEVAAAPGPPLALLDVEAPPVPEVLVAPVAPFEPPAPEELAAPDVVPAARLGSGAVEQAQASRARADHEAARARHAHDPRAKSLGVEGMGMAKP